MATRFSELSESEITCLFEQKIIFNQRRQLELIFIYFGNIYNERNSGKSFCNIESQASEVLGVKLLT